MSVETGQRRVYERVPFFCPVWIAARNGGPPAEARSFDISLGGVGLGAAGSVHVTTGSILVVTFRLNHPKLGPCEEPVVGRVARVGTDDEGILLGVEFLEPLRSDRQPRLTRAVEKL